MQTDQLTHQPKQQLDMLLNILSEQLGSYNLLLELIQRERSALTSSKLESINTVTTEKTCLVQKIGEIERRRVMIMADLARNFKMDPDHFTLIRLVDCVDQTTGKCLLQLRSDLSSVMQRLQKENDINKGLMIHCIELMDNSISMLRRMLFQEPTYIHTGHFASAEEGGVLFSGKV